MNKDIDRLQKHLESLGFGRMELAYTIAQLQRVVDEYNDKITAAKLLADGFIVNVRKPFNSEQLEEFLWTIDPTTTPQKFSKRARKLCDERGEMEFWVDQARSDHGMLSEAIHYRVLFGAEAKKVKSSHVVSIRPVSVPMGGQPGYRLRHKRL